jgi:hypothetical protein
LRRAEPRPAEARRRPPRIINAEGPGAGTLAGTALKPPRGEPGATNHGAERRRSAAQLQPESVIDGQDPAEPKSGDLGTLLGLAEKADLSAPATSDVAIAVG